MFNKVNEILKLIEKPRLILKGQHSKEEWECVVLNDLSFLDEMPNEFKTDELYKTIWKKIDEKLSLLEYIPIEMLKKRKNEDFLIEIIKKSFYHYSYFQITDLGFNDFSEELIKKIINTNDHELFYLHTDYYKNNTEKLFIYHLNEILDNNKNFDKYKQKDKIYKYEKIYKHILLFFLNNFNLINDKENLLLILLKNIKKIANYKFIKDIIDWGSYISLKEVKTTEFMKFLNNFLVKYPIFLSILNPLLTKSELLFLFEDINIQQLDNNSQTNLIKFFFDSINYSEKKYYQIAKKIISYDFLNLKYCKNNEFLTELFLDNDFIYIFNNFVQKVLKDYDKNTDPESNLFDCLCFIINIYFSQKKEINVINEIISNNKEFIVEKISIKNIFDYSSLMANLFNQNDIEKKFNKIAPNNYSLYLSELIILFNIFIDLNEDFLLGLYRNGYIRFYDLKEFVEQKNSSK